MRLGKVEILAIVLTVTGATAALLWPVLEEARSLERAAAGTSRVATLTALSAAGAWTDREVRAGDYWTGGFAAARPVFQVGEVALLRLKSADVHHSFYSPELGIGPVDVKPGHVAEVSFTPREPGLYPYYCTTVCGDPHFAMRGVIEVRDGDTPVTGSVLASAGRYWLLPPPAAGASMVDQGRWLFYSKGCATCHGWEGQGGVANFNYTDDTIPALHKTAANVFLRQPQHVEAVLGLLRRGVAVEDFEGEMPIPRFFMVKNQFRNVKKLIREGGVAGKKDVHGPEPPLHMPAWGHQLSEREIDSLLAFILTLSLEDRTG